MPAIDTVVGHAANPSTTFTGVTFNSGDSGAVRSFNPTDSCWLERITRSGTTSGAARVLSPLLHDNVRGITFTSPESPAVHLMPRGHGQRVYPQDTLTVQVTGGTGETDLVALSLYYTNLPGATARLHNWADINPLIAFIKPIEVDVTNSATIGIWTDTLINTTEALLKANTDYAILGYVTDTVQCMVGVKGSETGNLRVCGPGTTASDDTSDYFVAWSDREGTPHIPVVNAANIGAIYVSTCDTVASSTPKIQLVAAQLSSNLPN
jgi:hypothetical protein